MKLFGWNFWDETLNERKREFGNEFKNEFRSWYFLLEFCSWSRTERRNWTVKLNGKTERRSWTIKLNWSRGEQLPIKNSQSHTGNEKAIPVVQNIGRQSQAKWLNNLEINKNSQTILVFTSRSIISEQPVDRRSGLSLQSEERTVRTDKAIVSCWISRVACRA